jgi:hypothetical protein
MSTRSSSQRHAHILHTMRSITTNWFQQSSGNKKAEEDANKDAENKVKEIEEAGKKSGDKVIEDLIKAVTTPRPEVPDKFQKDS